MKTFYLVLFLSCCVGFMSASSARQNTLEIALTNIIYDGLSKYEETQTVIPVFQWAVDKVQMPLNVFRRSVNRVYNTGVCIGCAATIRYFIKRIKSGIGRDRLLSMASFICVLFNLQTEKVCHTLVDLNLDAIIFMVLDKENPSEWEICSTLLQNYGCFRDSRISWSISIPPGNTPKRFDEFSGKSAPFKVLQITDIHVDFMYAEGANAVCKEPVCCQRDQAPAKPGAEAGKWGDFRSCDMPPYALENLFDEVTKFNKETDEPYSYVYFTGDIVSHRIWETSNEANRKTIIEFYKKLKDVFGDIPVYPILGNHEVHPVNLFSPLATNHPLSSRWTYDLVALLWQEWLPPDTMETIRIGGYYTVLVKPGFRIVALNSNVCYIYNLWLLYQSEDPNHQLHWLTIVLKEAEANNESVHILSHVPPGDDTCLKEWARNYRRIVERFSNTITAEFNGHTHFDDLKIFFNSSNPSQVINVAYNGGSFSPYDGGNPNYRIYDVDSETYEIQDYTQWFYKIDEANLTPYKPPRWYKMYSFKDAYGLQGMRPENFQEFLEEMSTDILTLQQYFRFKYRDAKPKIDKGCDSQCHRDNLCNIVTTEYENDGKCLALTDNNSLFFKL